MELAVCDCGFSFIIVEAILVTRGSLDLYTAGLETLVMLSAQPHGLIYCMIAVFSWKKKGILLGEGVAIFCAFYLYQL